MCREIIKGSSVANDIATQMEMTVELYEKDEERLSEVNGLLQDVLHEIEESSYDVVTGFNVYKEIRELRKERRMLKNELRTLKPLYETLSKVPSISNEIRKAQGKSTIEESKMDNYKYEPRVRKEVREAINEKIEENPVEFIDNKDENKKPINRHEVRYTTRKELERLKRTLKLQWKSVEVNGSSNTIICTKPRGNLFRNTIK